MLGLKVNHVSKRGHRGKRVYADYCTHAQHVRLLYTLAARASVCKDVPSPGGLENSVALAKSLHAAFGKHGCMGQTIF